MDQQEALNVTLTINMPDCTEEELDAATRRFLRELREMDVESAALTSTGSNPPGAKGVDPMYRARSGALEALSYLPQAPWRVAYPRSRAHSRTAGVEK